MDPFCAAQEEADRNPVSTGPRPSFEAQNRAVQRPGGRAAPAAREPALAPGPEGARLPATAVLRRVRSSRAAAPAVDPGIGDRQLLPALARVGAERFDELEVAIDPQTRTYWCHMNPRERPSFTMGLLRDLARMQQSIRDLFDAEPDPADPPLRYFVVGSRLPGVFNLGGNLSFFADRIRHGDGRSLAAYARACIDVVFANAISLERPLVTIALVQGDAMGGGFEAVLSCNVVVAERGAKFGFPEVLFNLFPGMGACSFLSRRIGAARAEEMILSGRVYDAEEMHAMGIVHILAEPGCGQDAVRSYIGRNQRRHTAHRAVYEAARMINPLRFEEFERIADLWVEAALKLSESDLRTMERLVARQDRRRLAPQLLAAE